MGPLSKLDFSVESGEPLSVERGEPLSLEVLSLGGRLDLLWSLYSVLFVWKMNRATAIMPMNGSRKQGIAAKVVFQDLVVFITPLVSAMRIAASKPSLPIL